MRRRDLITLLGGAAAWPLAARAQQPERMRVIGYLHPESPEPMARYVAAFRKGLSETGHIEGRNVAIEYRWAQSNNDRLPELASDLARRLVAVIAAPGSTAAALAAKAATTTIPILFVSGVDPVELGLVASLNRPGGNLTGVSSMIVNLGGKQVGLLRELLPAAARIAVLINPKNPTARSMINDTQAAATAIGLQIGIVMIDPNWEVETAFAEVAKTRADALLIHGDAWFVARRMQITQLAARQALPTLYPIREDAEAGGLMSYGPNVPDNHRLVGVYAGRILNGEKPADLPVIRPTKFQLVINLKAAKTLALAVPDKLLALADEVIE
jgi:putative ABC transport system substrate-binding protein